MRSKRIARARPRLHLPPKSPTMPVPHIFQPFSAEAPADRSLGRLPIIESNDNNIQNIVLKSSSQINEDRNCQDLSPDKSGTLVVPHKMFRGLAPHNVQKREDFMKMDLIEQQICIKCDKGGKILVCSDSGCPIAVHENCMGCLPRFDEAGNFYCPYCLYRSAAAETCAAREKALLAEKALSMYMDKEKTDDTQNKQEIRTAKRRKSTPSTVVGKLSCCDSENRIRSNNIQNQSVKIGENQTGVAPVCTTNTLPSNENDMPILKEKDDVCGDNAGEIHSENQMMLAEHHTHPELVIACGDGVCCREQRTLNQFERIEVRNIVKAEYDDLQHERAFKDQQEAGHPRATHVVGDTNLSGAIDSSGRRKWKNAETWEVSEGKRIEEDQMQEHVEEATLSLKVPKPPLVVHSEFNRGLETSDKAIRDTEIVSMLLDLKDKHKHSVQPQNVDIRMRLTKKLPLELVASEMKNDKIITRCKSRQLEDPSKALTSSPCRGGKRIKWRKEEEEMLKVGVEKFSHMMNKNFPWRKVLDFGRDVFDVVRTPSDLKDKWRNILAKEHS